jgi:outer membrane protein TolC
LLATLLLATAVNGATAAPASLKLGAAEAAGLALDNGIAVLSGALDLKLQSQQLDAVARGEFRPKASLNFKGQSTGSRTDGTSATTANQYSSSFDTTWKLYSGTQLALRAVDSTNGGVKGRSVSVSLTQPLWRGFGEALATASLRSAESSLEIAKVVFEQTATETVSNTLQAYFALNLAVSRTRVAREGLQTAQRMDEVNRALVAAGRSPTSALLQSEAEVEQAKLAASQAEQEEVAARRALLVAIGDEASGLDRAVETPDLPEKYVDLSVPALNEAIELALASQPAIRMAHESVHSARLQLLQAQDQMKLPLDLTVSATRDPSLRGQPGMASAAVGLSSEIVLDRAPLRYARSAAQAGVRKAEMQFAEAQRTTRHAIADLISAHNFALQQLALAQRGAEIGRRRLEMELEKQLLGRSSSIELSSARREAVDAENQVAQSNYQLLLAKIAVWKATGTLLRQWGLADRVEEWSRELIK